jgi:hypothetical protein
MTALWRAAWSAALMELGKAYYWDCSWGRSVVVSRAAWTDEKRAAWKGV